MAGRTKGFRRTRLSAETAQEAQEANRKGRRFVTVDRRLKRLKQERDAALAAVNKRFDDRAAPLSAEHTELGNRLHILAQRLIPILNPDRRYVQIGSVRLSLKLGQPSLEIIDENAALSAIRQRRWAERCIRTIYRIRKDPLKKRLLDGPRPRRMRGVIVTPATQLLYVDDTKGGTQFDPSAGDSDDPTGTD